MGSTLGKYMPKFQLHYAGMAWSDSI